MPTNINNPVTIEGVELGRFLFYDPILSRDSTISCSSCHNQSASFSDSPRKFSKGINDKIQTRNTPPLFNLAWYESMFWDGRAKDIESQIFIPVTAHDEMDITWEEATVRVNQNSFYSDKFQKAFPNTIIDSTLISKAIGQFERTMLSYNSKYDRVLNRKDYFTPDEYQGFLLANDQSKGNCLHCHTTDSNGLGTTGKFSNNGLSTAKVTKEYLDRGKGGITKIENEIGLFKIPSLRNLVFTSPYMHDGSLNSLEDVLDFYSDDFNNCVNIDSKMMFNIKRNRALNTVEKRQIILFLKTLTDSTFVNDPLFKNPFLK